MRTLAITQNITLDGSIEMLGDWFADQEQAAEGNDDLMEQSRAQNAAADALLVGRQTFLDFRGYWRDLEGDATGISDYLNGVAKYVVSSTLSDEDLDWQHAHVLGGEVVEEVRRLKEADGKDIVCTGSITLTHALIEAGLVDEYRLFTYPVVQGGGRRLFPDGFEAWRLKLVGARAFRSGVTWQRYAAT